MTKGLKWTMKIMCPVCNAVMIPKNVIKSEEIEEGEWLDITYDGDCRNCGAELYIAHEFKNGKAYDWCIKQWITNYNGPSVKGYEGYYGYWVKDSPYCIKRIGKTKWEKYYYD